MITKTICRMIPVVAMALFVCSCNNDDNNDPTQDGNQVDFVTVKSITNAGTSFEVQKEGDSPVATLITSKKLSEGIKVGQRILPRQRTTLYQWQHHPHRIYDNIRQR